MTLRKSTISSIITMTASLSSSMCEEISFNKDIRPIFISKCTKCHGGAKADGDLSLIYRDEVLGKAKSGKTIITPGRPDKSELYRRIITDDIDDKMPLQEGEHADDPLSAEQCETIKKWIQQGAKWEDHWAYSKPQKRRLPAIEHIQWPRTTMDYWVLSQIESQGYTPSAMAPKPQWLRRVSLDLVGLPPTLQQLSEFEEDSSPGAYGKQVDRLLASRHFGERWASVWMDLARYSDTMGYEKDPHRDIWPYRDYLVNSFNSDKPYDQFIQEQLAGDLDKNPSFEQLIATAFHRNTQTNTEGGTDDEEYRVLATIDRVNTTWTAVQGLTFGCIQCHAHPYEPIPHADYYRFSAFFNNTEDADLSGDFPLFKLANEFLEREKAAELFTQLPALKSKLNQPGQQWIEQDKAWQPLDYLDVTATHGELKTYPNGQLRASGTLAIQTRFNIEAKGQNFQALRVTIIPEAEDYAELPERGSVLSHLQLEVVKADGTIEAIKIAHIYADSRAGPYDANDSAQANANGFGGYPKLFKQRQAVIVPHSPVACEPGDTLKLTIQNKASTTGNQACTLRRFKLEASPSDIWQKLITSEAHKKDKAELARTQNAYNNIKGTSVPVLQQRPESARRETRLFIGGLWLNKGELFTEGVPDLLNPKGKKITDRHKMAQWISSENNPLTARVMVNRLYAELFGRGIVQTLGDFGSTGVQPSNLALLDHLAIEFQGSQKWSIKKALRNMVLSAAYRQDHRASKELAEKDPHNIYLARGPRTRLNAEMIRDNALQVSGLLTTTFGGASVMPPQPEGIWQSVYSGAKWKTAEGPNRYRRALYTYWKRTSPYPSMLTFDAPSRDICAPQRIATNTPLHALITLNDPVYLECSKTLAQRMIVHASALDEQIKYGYLLACQDSISPSNLAILKALHKKVLSDFTSRPMESAKINKTPEDAAMTVLANTILNLDKALTK